MNDHQNLLLAYINAHLTTDSEILATGSVIHETNVDFVSRLVTQIVHIGQGANQIDYIKINMFAADMPYCATKETESGEEVEYDIQLRIYKGNGRYILLKPEYYSVDKTTVYFKIEKTATDLRGELLANLCVTEPADVTSNGDGTYTINSEVKAMYSQLITLIIDEVAQASKEYQSQDPNMDSRVLALEAEMAKGGIYKPDYITIDRKPDGSDGTYKLYTTGILQDTPYKIQLTKEESMKNDVGYFLQYSTEAGEGNYFGLYVDGEKQGLHLDTNPLMGLFGNVYTSEYYPIKFGINDGYLQIGNITGKTEGETTSAGLVYNKSYAEYETNLPDDEKTWKDVLVDKEVVNVEFLSKETDKINTRIDEEVIIINDRIDDEKDKINKRIDELDFDNFKFNDISEYSDIVNDPKTMYNRVTSFGDSTQSEEDTMALYTSIKTSDNPESYVVRDLIPDNYLFMDSLPDLSAVPNYNRKKVFCVKDSNNNYELYKIYNNAFVKLAGSAEGITYKSVTMAQFNVSSLPRLERNTVYILKYVTPINSSWNPYSKGYAYNSTGYSITTKSFYIYIFIGDNTTTTLTVNGYFYYQGERYDVEYYRGTVRPEYILSGAGGYISYMRLARLNIEAYYDFISYNSFHPVNTWDWYTSFNTTAPYLRNISIKTHIPCCVTLYETGSYTIQNVYIESNNAKKLYFSATTGIINGIWCSGYALYNIYAYGNTSNGIKNLNINNCDNIQITTNSSYTSSSAKIIDCHLTGCSFLNLYGVMTYNKFHNVKGSSSYPVFVWDAINDTFTNIWNESRPTYIARSDRCNFDIMHSSNINTFTGLDNPSKSFNTIRKNQGILWGGDTKYYYTDLNSDYTKGMTDGTVYSETCSGIPFEPKVFNAIVVVDYFLSTKINPLGNNTTVTLTPTFTTTKNSSGTYDVKITYTLNSNGRETTWNYIQVEINHISFDQYPEANENVYIYRCQFFSTMRAYVYQTSSNNMLQSVFFHTENSYLACGENNYSTFFNTRWVTLVINNSDNFYFWNNKRW